MDSRSWIKLATLAGILLATGFIAWTALVMLEATFLPTPNQGPSPQSSGPAGP